MKKVLYTIGMLLLILILVLIVRTFRFQSKQVLVKMAPQISVDSGAVQRLSGALQIPTISHQDPSQNKLGDFAAFRTFLEQSFPLVHQKLTREVVGELGLLYVWKGKDDAQKPILLMSHFDVVPVEAGTEKDWKYPPFSGTIAEGFVWGRGAIDDKMGVIGILEAAELMLRNNFQPVRTIYFAFGGDEEIGGTLGAGSIGKLLRDRNVTLDFVLDEGMTITENLIPGIYAPVAMVGVAEKGYLSVELSVDGKGGHSSMPPELTTIGILSRAIDRLEKNRLPMELRSPAYEMFQTLGPEMGFKNRMVLANLWLLQGVFKRMLEMNPESASMLRTTTAPTIFQSGTKENVLPSRARAVVNFRLLPGDSVDGVLKHIRNSVADGRVRINKLLPFNEPSAVSNLKSENFRTLQVTIREVFPNVLVTPALLMGGTDTKYYAGLSSDIYRFAPIRLGPDDLSRIHGTNERIAIKNFEECVRFYYQLLVNCTASTAGTSHSLRTSQ